MAKFTTYTTQDGDRWDLVAYRAYGNALDMSGIIRANPHVPLDVNIQPGTKLFIPIKERPAADKSLLPPWRR